jgi:hypothetical protein
LLQLAGFRFPAKVFRPSFYKVNPFNLFLQDRKHADIEDLRKPAPGRPEVNMGRPAFNGDYQKQLADEYKLHKPEYQQKAKELNEDPKAKLNADSALKRYRKLMRKTTDFGQELAKHDIHHIIMIVPQSASLRARIVASNGYGEAYYKLLTQKGLNGTQFDAFCRGNELQAQLEQPAQAKDLTRDGLRKRVAEKLLGLLSKLKVLKNGRSPESLMPVRCFKHWCSACPVTTSETCRGTCFLQPEVGRTRRFRQLTARDHRQVDEL